MPIRVPARRRKKRAKTPRRASASAAIEARLEEGLVPLQVRVPATLLAQLRTIATARRNAGTQPYTHQALGLEAVRWVVEKYK